MTIHKHRFAVWTLFAVVAIGSLSACNTIEGAGKDIKSTGKAIEDAADHD